MTIPAIFAVVAGERDGERRPLARAFFAWLLLTIALTLVTDPLTFACVVLVTSDLVRRVMASAHALITMTQRLEAMVLARTRELAAAQQALARSERLAALGHLAAGVAHEINNPLVFVRSNVDFLADQLLRFAPPEFRAECEEAARETQDGVERIRRIALDLKVFARGPQPATREAVDVPAVIDSALRLVRNEARTRAVVRTELGLVPPVSGDAARLAQVIVNLVINAVQAIPEGRPTDNEICVSTQRAGAGQVVIEVKDTGMGMPPEIASHIFEPYFTTKQATGGTGLGLAICHGLVGEMGGSIVVDSAPGRGTVMRVTLPEHVAKAPALEVAAA